MPKNKFYSPKLYLQDLARGCLDIGSKNCRARSVSNMARKLSGSKLSRILARKLTGSICLENVSKNFQARSCLEYWLEKRSGSICFENVSKNFRNRHISKVFEHNRAVSPTRWRYQSQV